MIKVSAVIPSYRDPLLQKTIDSLLNNSELGDQLEVIAILDGYWPIPPLKADPRVKVVHFDNRGMRGAINAGVAVAQGEYIARFDEHIMVCPGWDRILVEGYEKHGIEKNCIVTGKRFFLDPVKWEIMDNPPIEFQRLIIGKGGDRRKFAGVGWPVRDQEWKDVMIGETMAMQGSMWCMPKAWWEKVIVELQSEGYGTHYQDSVEMIFKTWQAGGKLILNKNMWYAHKHRSFNRTHNYGGELADKSFEYALGVWEDYYRKEIRPRFGL